MIFRLKMTSRIFSEVIFSLTPILMRFSLFTLLFTCFSLSLFAQEFHTKKDVSASVLKKYYKAGDYAQRREIEKAMETYAFCIKKEHNICVCTGKI